MPEQFGQYWGGYSDTRTGYDRTPTGENAPQIVQDTTEGLFGSPLGNFLQDIENQGFGLIQDDKNRFFGEDITIGQALFGGSSNRSGQRQFVYGPQDQFAKNYLYPYMGSLVNQFGSNPYRLTAGQDPYQTLGQGVGRGAALAAQSNMGQLRNAYGRALDPSSSFSEPLFRDSLQASLNPFIRNFQQNVMPSITSHAVGVGQMGGSRQGIAEGLAAQNLQQQIADVASQFGQNAYNQGIASRNAALGMAPQVIGSQFIPSQFLQDTGAARRDIRQQQLSSPLTFGSSISTMMGSPTVLGEGYSRGTSQRGITQGFGDVFGGGGGGGGGLGGFIGGLFSDRRLKRNIRKIADTASGLAIYVYNYVWGQPGIGYMADEVERVNPSAVMVHPSGYKMVNYREVK